MAHSDIRRRFDQRSKEQHQKEKATEQTLKNFLRHDPEIRLFRSQYLNLFESIVRDCGRQLGRSIKSRKAGENEMSALSFVLYEGLIEQLFGQCLYCDNFHFGSVFTGERVENYKLMALVHVPLGSDQDPESIPFADVPRDRGAAEKFLNDFLYRRFKYFEK